MSFQYGSQFTTVSPFPVTYQPPPFTTVPPFLITNEPLQFTAMPPFAYQSQMSPQFIMMSSPCLQSPQLFYGYSLPASGGDTWASDFNDRVLERVTTSSGNYIGTSEDLPVENILGFVPADRTTVENLEVKKAGEELATHDEVCSVCLQGWENGQEAKILPCGHYFHPACADQWLLTNRFCPLCRFELPAAEQE